jgi:hypothetical protein
MRPTQFAAPVLSVVVAAGLLTPGVELPAAPRENSYTVHHPQIALMSWTSPAPLPLTEFPWETLAADAAPVIPIDIIDAIGAAAYLAVAGPLLVVSIPFQVITGQSEDIIVSLNNLIQAANTILKLVGRSIAPIPVPSAADADEAEDAGASGDVDETERADEIERTDEAEDSDDTEDADEDDADEADTDEADTEPDADDADTEDTEDKDTEAQGTAANSDTVTG